MILITTPTWAGTMRYEDEGTFIGNPNRVDCLGDNINCSFSNGEVSITISNPSSGDATFTNLLADDVTFTHAQIANIGKHSAGDATFTAINITNKIIEGSDRVIGKRWATVTIENLAAADDNFEIFTPYQAITVTDIGCYSQGTPAPAAQISLEDRAGNAMTHSVHGCTVSTSATTFTSVTAANSLTAGEGLRFDVDNAVSPETNAVSITVGYTID